MKFLTVIAVVTIVGFCTISIDNSLRSLKITRQEAIEYVSSSLESATLSLPPECRNIPTKLQESIVLDMISLTHEWTQTQDFKNWYAQYRNRMRPSPPPPPQGAGEVNSEKLLEIRQLEETARHIIDLPEGQRPAMQRMVDSTRAALLQEQQQFSPEQLLERDRAAHEAFQKQIDEFNIQNAFWQKYFPENPSLFLTTRMEEYLDLESNVDFKATTKKNSKGDRVFVNPVYEAKSWQWKQCYRMGKSVNAISVKAIKNWLLELKQ